MTSILVDHEGGIATITLNRPQVLNALNPDMAFALKDALQGLAEDRAVRCVVVKGAGEAFMAGGDVGFFNQVLPELQRGEVNAFKEIFTAVHGVVQCLDTMPQPVVAAIHGAVAGFGVSLVCACDLAVAADDAVFDLAYWRLGTTPDGGATYWLPQILGVKRAMAFALTGQRLDAKQALEWGLINQVASRQELDQQVIDTTRRLAAGPRQAFANTKHLLRRGTDTDLAQQLEAEQKSFLDCVVTQDFTEGVQAFLAKRKPEFK